MPKPPASSAVELGKTTAGENATSPAAGATAATTSGGSGGGGLGALEQRLGHVAAKLRGAVTEVIRQLPLRDKTPGEFVRVLKLVSSEDAGSRRSIQYLDGAGVTLVLGKLGGGAGRRSNGICRGRGSSIRCVLRQTRPLHAGLKVVSAW